ncbi:probable RNA-binding protein 46 [Macrosteles quadrilineatus]|uniref:probable RNA-binding protein 46 n=1 Tax=Macrosteles quadrilineatus TaxID=74068 RepID=UPI0023E2AE22|nr:probable RNA-binding protein 46 [Macrosteles quadrilineatus]
MNPQVDIHPAAEMYPSRQINGCRIYGPHVAFQTFTPPQGSEVFLAGIPPNFSHWELLKICQKGGVVFKLRVMVTRTNDNKGYAFVSYLDPECAARAKPILNGYHLIKDGKFLGHLRATDSNDHRTLMLLGCSTNVTTEEVEDLFRKLTTDLVSVSRDFGMGQARPVFFLTFGSNRSATLVKKIDLVTPPLWGHFIRLSWQPYSNKDHVCQCLRLKREQQFFRQMLLELPVLQQDPANPVGNEEKSTCENTLLNPPVGGPQGNSCSLEKSLGLAMQSLATLGLISDENPLPGQSASSLQGGPVREGFGDILPSEQKGMRF